jgi:hypothetical protein
MPFRPGPNSGIRTPTRQNSVDARNEVHVQMNHYIGIDVGTGSARACIINEAGDIVGLSSENIGLWQPETGYYVRLPVPLYVLLLDGQSNQFIVGTIHHRYLALYLHQCPPRRRTEQHRPSLNPRNRVRRNMFARRLHA